MTSSSFSTFVLLVVCMPLSLSALSLRLPTEFCIAINHFLRASVYDCRLFAFAKTSEDGVNRWKSPRLSSALSLPTSDAKKQFSATRSAIFTVFLPVVIVSAKVSMATSQFLHAWLHEQLYSQPLLSPPLPAGVAVFRSDLLIHFFEEFRPNY